MAVNYQAILEKARERAFNHYHDQTSAWKVSSKSTSALKIESKSSDVLNCSVYRFSHTVGVSPQVVLDTYGIFPGSKRMDWDKDMREVKVMERLSENVTIQQMTTNPVAMGVISPREFVNVMAIEIDGDKEILFYGGCVPDYVTPKTSEKYVRGATASFLLKATRDPSNPSQTLVTTIAEMDLKGRLPRSIVDSVLPGVTAQEVDHWMKYLSERGLLAS